MTASAILVAQNTHFDIDRSAIQPPQTGPSTGPSKGAREFRVLFIERGYITDLEKLVIPRGFRTKSVHFRAKGFPPKVSQSQFRYGNPLEWRSCLFSCPTLIQTLRYCRHCLNYYINREALPVRLAPKSVLN